MAKDIHCRRTTLNGNTGEHTHSDAHTSPFKRTHAHAHRHTHTYVHTHTHTHTQAAAYEVTKPIYQIFSLLYTILLKVKFMLSTL